MQGVFEQLDQAGYLAARLLLSHLWQTTVLFAAVGLLSYFLRSQSASVRRGLWLTALLVAPTLPFLSPLITQFGAPHVRVLVLPSYSRPPASQLPDYVKATAWNWHEPAPDLEETLLHPATVQPDRSSKNASQEFPWAMLAVLYVSGVCAFLISTCLGRWRIRQWRRTSRPLSDPRILRAYKQARKLLDLRRGVSVRESSEVTSPLTVGHLRPLVLMPTGIGKRLTDEQLLAIATHELAHVRRYDSLVLMGVALVRALLFFHPLVWVASRRVSCLIEETADETVLATTHQPLAYAKLLVHFAEGLSTARNAAGLAAGIVLTRSTFVQRVEAILSDRSSRVRQVTRVALATILGAVTAAVVLAVAVPLSDRGEAAQATPHSGILGYLYRATNLNRTLEIGIGREYPTLKAALAASRPGDTLQIAEGAVLKEHITITHSLQIVGETPQIPQLVGGIRFTAPGGNLAVHGLHVSNPQQSGIFIDNATGASVSLSGCNLVQNNGRGIHVDANQVELRIIGSNIADNASRGVEVSSSIQRYGTDVEIDGCCIARNGRSSPTNDPQRGRAIEFNSLADGSLKVNNSFICVTEDGANDRAIQLDCANLKNLDISFVNSSVHAPTYNPVTREGNNEGIGFKIKSATATVNIEHCLVRGFRHTAEFKSRGCQALVHISDSEFSGFANGRGLIFEDLTGKVVVENVVLAGNPGPRPAGGDEALRIRYCSNLDVQIHNVSTTNTEEAITIDRCPDLASVSIADVVLRSGSGNGHQALKLLANEISSIKVENANIQGFRTGLECFALGSQQSLSVTNSSFLSNRRAVHFLGQEGSYSNELLLDQCVFLPGATSETNPIIRVADLGSLDSRLILRRSLLSNNESPIIRSDDRSMATLDLEENIFDTDTNPPLLLEGAGEVDNRLTLWAFPERDRIAGLVSSSDDFPANFPGREMRAGSSVARMDESNMMNLILDDRPRGRTR